MLIREATIEDVPQIQHVRNSVKENILTNPNLVRDVDCIEFITVRGKGWVCQIDKEVVGFSIVDLKEKNVWALFLKPEYEKRGIARQLHDIMLDWYLQQTKSDIWLSTDPMTRAERFYRKAGWIEVGKHGGEIKFEMTYNNWVKKGD